MSFANAVQHNEPNISQYEMQAEPQTMNELIENLISRFNTQEKTLNQLMTRLTNLEKEIKGKRNPTLQKSGEKI